MYTSTLIIYTFTCCDKQYYTTLYRFYLFVSSLVEVLSRALPSCRMSSCDSSMVSGDKSPSFLTLSPLAARSVSTLLYI